MSTSDLPFDQVRGAPALDGVVLDHVAVAVDDLAAAAGWWRSRQAAPVAAVEAATFATAQLRMGNGGKVELIGRTDAPGFIGPFLDRFGSGRIHHVTLTVPGPLADAVEVLQGAGLDVVDVDTSHTHWHEAFLRPSQAGGLIVQVAWADGDDAAFAARQGLPAPQPPSPAAPPLQRVVLGHPRPADAAALWRVLGAVVEEEGQTVVARFDRAPIAVEIRPAPQAGPLGLRLGDATAPAGPASPAWLPG